MIVISIFIFIRIIANSLLNVFQKCLTNMEQKASVVNFYTYMGLGIISVPLLGCSHIEVSTQLLLNVLLMGVLGALGNYYIIKALSIGELSVLAPINSYKPVVAMIVGLLYLREIPSLSALGAILLILLGSIFIFDSKVIRFDSKSIIYRFLALVFSATEAIFIKRIIELTTVNDAFYLWCISGCVVAGLFVVGNKKNDFKIKSLKFQLLLVFSVALMQYTTNYVFSRMNVAYALALFQLSTIVSVIMGANFFKEKYISRKMFSAMVMLFGAIILILMNS